jgi:hypothetical protein
MTKKKLYNWPEGYFDRNYLPLHQMFRRIIMTPIIALGFVICYSGILLGFGIVEAERFRGDFR